MYVVNKSRLKLALIDSIPDPKIGSKIRSSRFNQNSGSGDLRSDLIFLQNSEYEKS